MTRLAASIVFATAVIAASHVAAQSPAFWVEQLGADSYAQRLRARTELISAGQGASPALQNGQDAADLEVRKQSATLLKEIQRSGIETEIRRMQTATQPGQSYQLPGWPEFREIVGDDRETRALFVAITRQFRQPLQQLASGNTTPWPLTDRIRDATDHDAVAWGLLLLANNHPGNGTCLVNHYVRDRLNESRISASLQASQHATVLRRLVAHSLQRQAGRSADRIWMRIAIQWKCESQAVELARQATSPGRVTSPACTATALAILTRFAPDQARPVLLQALDDKRTTQVWQIVAVTRRRLQTQVSDVSLAMLLFLEGVDPRDMGFEDIQADPLTIYSEHTLGFPDDAKRHAALESASRAGVIPLRFVD